jgi:hypothetical protein
LERHKFVGWTKRIFKHSAHREEALAGWAVGQAALSFVLFIFSSAIAVAIVYSFS